MVQLDLFDDYELTDYLEKCITYDEECVEYDPQQVDGCCGLPVSHGGSQAVPGSTDPTEPERFLLDEG